MGLFGGPVDALSEPAQIMIGNVWTVLSRMSNSHRNIVLNMSKLVLPGGRSRRDAVTTLAAGLLVGVALPRATAVLGVAVSEEGALLRGRRTVATRHLLPLPLLLRRLLRRLLPVIHLGTTRSSTRESWLRRVYAL